MAKRLTDTDKWKKPFIKSLPLEYKLLWLYILDDCDHAGLWQVDIEIAEIRLGTKLSLEKARGYFAKNMVVLDNGTKWFIPDFISFQYGAFNESNKMYRSILPILSKYDLMGHLSPINGVKVQVPVMVMVKEKYVECLKQEVGFVEQTCMAWNLQPPALEKMIEVFFQEQTAKSKSWADYRDFKSHFFSWGKYRGRFNDYRAETEQKLRNL